MTGLTKFLRIVTARKDNLHNLNFILMQQQCNSSITTKMSAIVT